jgi:hypothetical protein
MHASALHAESPIAVMHAERLGIIAGRRLARSTHLEVHAGELVPCLSTPGRLRSARRGRAAPPTCGASFAPQADPGMAHIQAGSQDAEEERQSYGHKCAHQLCEVLRRKVISQLWPVQSSGTGRPCAAILSYPPARAGRRMRGPGVAQARQQPTWAKSATVRREARPCRGRARTAPDAGRGRGGATHRQRCPRRRQAPGKR